MKTVLYLLLSGSVALTGQSSVTLGSYGVGNYSFRLSDSTLAMPLRARGRRDCGGRSALWGTDIHCSAGSRRTWDLHPLRWLGRHPAFLRLQPGDSGQSGWEGRSGDCVPDWLTPDLLRSIGESRRHSVCRAGSRLFGLDQINLQVSANTPSGNNQLTMKFPACWGTGPDGIATAPANDTTTNTVTLPVQ